MMVRSLAQIYLRSLLLAKYLALIFLFFLWNNRSVTKCWCGTILHEVRDIMNVRPKLLVRFVS